MENLKVGDLIVKKYWWGFDKKIVNGVINEEHLLVSDFDWSGRQYKAQHSKVVPKQGWLKVQE